MGADDGPRLPGPAADLEARACGATGGLGPAKWWGRNAEAMNYREKWLPLDVARTRAGVWPPGCGAGAGLPRPGKDGLRERDGVPLSSRAGLVSLGTASPKENASIAWRGGHLNFPHR